MGADKRYVILPPTNRFNADMRSRSIDAWRTASRGGMASVGLAGLRAAKPAAVSSPFKNVLSRIGRDEALLVSLSEPERLALKREYPGLVVQEDGIARMAHMQFELRAIPAAGMAVAGGQRELLVKVQDPGGKPLTRCTVLALTDVSTRPPEGAEAETDATGTARFLLPASRRVQRVVVPPVKRHWGTFWSSAGKQPRQLTLVCREIDPAAQDDGLRRLHAVGNATDGQGVTVAVVDGGATHPALHVAGGANLSDKGPEDDLRDNGVGHGTHVAGIIAGLPRRRTPVGLAPGVRLLVYRVFDKHQTTTGSFAVASAIRRAVDEGADLVNVSLTLEDLDLSWVESEIKRARAMGVVCVAAAGNTGDAVKCPARFSSAIGVSAIGMRTGWPRDRGPFAVAETPKAKLMPAVGPAGFSCHGPEIDFTAPGVGVLSLLPGGYGVMDGTSMAAPAVTGLLARALAARPELLRAPRDQARSDAIVTLAAGIARSLGLPAAWEGHGVLPG